MEVALGGLEVGVPEDVADGHGVEHPGEERAGGVAETDTGSNSRITTLPNE